jgi:hypothetical protein
MMLRSASPNFGQDSRNFQNAKVFAYGNPTRNQDHPQKKHNEANRNKLCVSTSFLYWDTGRPLKWENEAKAKNTTLKKQCLGMTTKPQNRERKSKKHGEWRHNEPPPVLHGNGLVE